MTKRLAVTEKRQKEGQDTTEWILECLNVSSGRDVNQTALKIVKYLIKNNRRTVSSEELANKLELTTGAINHHVRALMDSGLVVREKRKIQLRDVNLTETLKQIQRDVDSIFEKLIEASEN